MFYSNHILPIPFLTADSLQYLCFTFYTRRVVILLQNWGCATHLKIFFRLSVFHVSHAFPAEVFDRIIINIDITSH
jgi:hypothetical protein